MKKSIQHRNLILRNSLAASLAALLLILPLRLPAGEISAHHPDLPRHPLTLQDCIDIALGLSPKLEASRFDLLAAGEEIRAAQAALWPNLKGSATGEAFSGERTGKFGIVLDTGGGGGGVSANRQVDFAGVGVGSLRLDYPVFKDGSIFGFNDAPAVALKRAKKNALAWTAHLTGAEVRFRVTEAFVATVSAQNRVEPIDHRVELLQRAVDITREEKEKGLLLDLDVKVATDQLNGARSLAKIIHQQAVAGALALTQLLGLPSSSHIRLNSTLPEPPATPDAGRLFATMLAQHPALQVQRAKIEQAKADYRLESFRLYPDVDAFARTLYITDFHDNAHVGIGGITVNIPIWDWGTQLNKMRASRDTYNAERARLGAVANDLASELIGIYREIYDLSEHILTLQEETGKLDRDLRVATSQEQQGIAPPLTAITAELQLIGKREELTIARERRLLLAAKLQKMMADTWQWRK